MVTYIVRRLFTAVLILLGASFLVYQLTALSGDPLADLRTSNQPNKEELIQQRIELLDLNVPAPVRYFHWLGGAAKCLVPFVGQCDLGFSITGQPVTEALGRAMGMTILLVSAAAILAVLIGVSLGIVTALRQYSTLDYGVTFMAFLFFSLPVFWVAVLLKEYVAIGFNNFLREPQIPLVTIIIVSVVSGLIWFICARGTVLVRLKAAGIGLVLAGGVLWLLSATSWFSSPGLGLPVIAVAGAGVAFGATLLTAGLKNRRALYSSLTMVAVGIVLYFPIQPLLAQATGLMIFLLAVATILVGLGVGYVMGGYDRRQNMSAAVITSFLTAGLVLLDRYMQAWPAYFNNNRVNGRPIATIGAETPNLEGDFWVHGLDTFTHLLLPTIALLLISLASYSRYSRSSMLEIMNMDYIRTARAKGLGERTVVMRHAFRNALIPIATIVAYDIGGLIGGAVITERVFAFAGMGQLFIQALDRVDPNPVMGVFLVTGVLALVFNLIADLVYSALDPRVRVKA
ncbi:ABC transporter permease [Arthrobacter crystallopoietes]|jgi:peptide/nickel transport system permease protein|uniref:ABC transporter permease n=1 Tax=Crystallibacter crystallopoietes TaxID=37928 RepID=UPI0011112934|nr:ABC transporter permease [Arthrobacter crystallopoietes]QTG80732.1 ABC transporter permease [Arthrobacter crystallopoietes]